MQLDGVKFRGYKAFPGGDNDASESQQLSLAPLTLVFGKNNSGKSAVVRLPRLLLGGLAWADERILPLEVRGLKYGARFVDLVHGSAFFQRPSFGVQASHNGMRLDLTATLYTSGALTADKPPLIWSYQMREPQTIALPPPTEASTERLPFAGLLPAGSSWDTWREAASKLLDASIHLGPMREDIQSAYLEEQPEKLGLDGRQAPQWLRADPGLMDATSSWFETNMDGWRLSLVQSNETFYLRAGLGKTMAANLAQAGEGLKQVLPVVVHQLWRQRQERNRKAFLDVVEHPDLHLHAAAQAPLADLFIDTAVQGKGVVLVETHSKQILLRLQRRIAEGRLPHDRVALYFVEVTAEGSRLRPVGLSPDGEVEWWPEGVFEESFREVAAMSRAQRQKRPGGRLL